MKLRNFMYATMIACAFASCSKDDEIPTPGTEPAAEGTTLSLQIAAPTLTKADESVDADINTLSMLVFEESNNTLEAIGTKDGDNLWTKAVEVKAGSKSIIVLANVTLPAAVEKGATLTVVQNALQKALNAQNAIEAANNLTMNSKLYTKVQVAPDTKNMLGFTQDEATKAGGALVTGIDDAASKVKLYRTVARIVLNEVKTKEYYGTNTDKIAYKSPKLDVTDVFLLQGSKMTSLWSATEYAATEIVDGGFLFGKTGFSDEEKDNYTLVDYTEADVYSGYNIDVTSWEDITTTPATKGTVFYAYENTSSNRTLLVVAGKFSYLTGEGENTRVEMESTRYYPIAIGVSDVTFSANAVALLKDIRGLESYKGVYRNLQYNVNLTIVGPGYKRPTGGGDPTTIESQVEVVAYGDVNQDVEI